MGSKQQPLQPMKVTKEALEDKLQLFRLAGFDTEYGWDTAIPQVFADQLRDMGIEDISSYWVTDCTRLLYKLHHTGEAFAAILRSRSDTNHDALRGLMDAPDTATFMEMINTYRELWDEIDAGFLNVSLLAVVFNHAFNEGYKHATKHNQHLGVTDGSGASLPSEAPQGNPI